MITYIGDFTAAETRLILSFIDNVSKVTLSPLFGYSLGTIARPMTHPRATTNSIVAQVEKETVNTVS